jgi:redox-sensitive bicupin YhaK (pirin superfamily)
MGGGRILSVDRGTIAPPTREIDDMDSGLVGAGSEAGRRVVGRTRGQGHGGITRLMSPSDVGEMLKPFVFLDRIEVRASGPMQMGWHPHSGIATVSYLFEGAAAYEESNGSQGVIPAGGVEWMRAGGGIWHTGGSARAGTVRGYQLWVALPAALENGPAESRYLAPDEVPTVGPARVILGRLGAARSPVPSPEGMTYLAVSLAPGERWTWQPEPGHTLAFAAVHTGELTGPAPVAPGELAVFAEGDGALRFEAKVATDFIVGSAVKHPHALVLGRYSVHTSPAALREGEGSIARLGRELRAQGRG